MVKSRAVSKLSEVQRHRKRAHDRAAQRIIRQRTKDKIESLERQVAEFIQYTSQLKADLDATKQYNANVTVFLRSVLGNGKLLRSAFPDSSTIRNTDWMQAKVQHMSQTPFQYHTNQAKYTCRCPCLAFFGFLITQPQLECRQSLQPAINFWRGTQFYHLRAPI
jgi:hypothetical protein